MKMPAQNKLRSFLNELSDGADSVARKMSGGGGGRRGEAEASDAAPSTWWQKRKPSAPPAPPGAPSSSSGDDPPFVPREGRGTLPKWNGSSAASLVDKEYSSNYTADVNVHEAPWLDAAEGSRGAGSSRQVRSPSRSGAPRCAPRLQRRRTDRKPWFAAGRLHEASAAQARRGCGAGRKKIVVRLIRSALGMSMHGLSFDSLSLH